MQTRATHNEDFFDGLLALSADWIIGTESYFHVVLRSENSQDNYSEVFDETYSFFRNHAKDAILRPCMPYDEFRDLDNGYYLYVSDKRHQEEHTSSQMIRVDFEFSRQPYVACKLVFKNKLSSVR